MNSNRIFIAEMEYVLLDIKNFLKKLENGQLEIEAGQWELHKALSNMNKAVADLKSLRQDVEVMKISNLKQMGLIKELQAQLDRLNVHSEQDPLSVSESSVEYSRVYKRPIESQGAAKGFKKRKCHIRSEEIIEITSQVSNEKSEQSGSNPECNEASGENEKTELNCSGKEGNSDEDSEKNNCKKESYIVPVADPPNEQYPCSANNDILQRYLKDSVKYVDRKQSNSTQSQPTCQSSQRTDGEDSHSAEYTPFWDEYGSRSPPENHSENRNTKVRKECSKANDPPVEKKSTKKFTCHKCTTKAQKFSIKPCPLRYDRKYRKAETVFHCKNCGKGFGNLNRLKNHAVVHKMSKSFKGFRCSYCSKICCSPEKLTAHLRKCRIITKAQYKKK